MGREIDRRVCCFCIAREIIQIRKAYRGSSVVYDQVLIRYMSQRLILMKEMELKAELLYSANCILGESPLWDAAGNCWLWVDIDGKKLFRYECDNRSVQIHSFNEKVSLVVHDQKGNLVLGMEKGISRYELETRDIIPLSDLDADWNNMRCNDGICDSNGRLWIGTTDMNHKTGSGKVYCVEKHKARVCIDHVSISNGMAWSPDNTRLYYTDSATGNILSYLFDSESGEIAFEKIAVRISSGAGLPDGMAMDEEGILWVAIWGGSMVGGYEVQTGRLVGKIEMIVPNVTSCAFGGENMDQLFITTACSYKGAGMEKKDEHSGDVFIANMKVKGVPVNVCRL